MDDYSVSIAVMPFRNLSPEPEMEFFADGFVEDLIADLTRFLTLRVVASQSTFGLSQTDRSVDDVAEEWDLQYVLEGSVRRGGSEIRVSVQLIRVDGHETVWAERFDARLNEVFAIQDDLRQRSRANLRYALMTRGWSEHAAGRLTSCRFMTVGCEAWIA